MTTAELTEIERGIAGLPIVDCDFHNSSGGRFVEHLPKRWQEFLQTTGRRNFDHFGCTTQQKPLACRLDSHPPAGGPPGSDPDFARRQLLDAYGITAAVINNIECIAGGGSPVEFEIAHARAINDHNREAWFPHDPRWLAAINVAADHPQSAVDEIERCCALSDRFVQVLIGSRTERPQGNPKYWPIYETAAAHGLPVAFHVANSKYNHWTGAGAPDYYFEVHTSFPLPTQSMVASMVFEGLFEHVPDLKIVAVELGWEWIVPFAWRLDASWRVLRDEVSHLTKRPSDYVREHFWFTTQPCVETEDPQDVYGLYEQFVDFGLEGHLLFASDYPHWDMDSPFEALPVGLPRSEKARILGNDGAALYGVDLAASR